MKKEFFLNYIFYLAVILVSNFQITEILGQNGQSVGTPIDFSNGNEIDPVLSNDGRFLAFILDNNGITKLYISKKTDHEQWSEPEYVAEINDYNGANRNIRYPAFNYDASVIYYSADFNKDSSDFDIFYSNFNGINWSDPISIGNPINSISFDGQPSISADNQTIYFVRNKVDNTINTQNCKTILYSRKNEIGQWSEPELLTFPINVECDQSPRIGIDNKTLYFSSNRDGGKNGLDIYKSEMIAKNIWSPVEIIESLNTVNNDYAPTFSFDSDICYYSIEKIEKNNSTSIISKSTLPTQFLVGKSIMFSGKIKDLYTQKPIAAYINVYDPITSTVISQYSNNPITGDYQFYLSDGNDYKIEFFSQGYSHSINNIKAIKLSKNVRQIQDINLFNFIQLNINVLDAEKFNPLDCEIEISNGNKEIIEAQIDYIQKGKYLVNLPIGDNYQIKVNAAYFNPRLLNFDLSGIVQFNQFEEDVELKSQKIDLMIAVSDEETQAGLPFEGSLKNLQNGETIKFSSPNTEGKYNIKLNDGYKYEINLASKGYTFYDSIFDLGSKQTPRALFIKLDQLNTDSKLILKNISFESKTADLKESSFPELEKVVMLMNQNPDIKIEIGVSTDILDSDLANLKLSKQQANALFNYLLDQKIPFNRMSIQGYGKLKNLLPVDADVKSPLNQKVELKFSKIQ